MLLCDGCMPLLQACLVWHCHAGWCDSNPHCLPPCPCLPLQAKMEVVGIGSSVLLFGVLLSTVNIQILFLGTMLKWAFTCMCLPSFWTKIVAQ
jgi:hypothetical protein